MLPDEIPLELKMILRSNEQHHHFRGTHLLLALEQCMIAQSALTDTRGMLARHMTTPPMRSLSEAYPAWHEQGVDQHAHDRAARPLRTWQ